MEESRGGADRSQARGRARVVGEVRLPRQDQPRDPHAAQRHHRLLRGDDGGALRPDRQRTLPAISEGHPRLGRASDLADQRPARPVQDRGGQARAHLRQRVGQRPDAAMRRDHAAAGQPRAHHHPHLAVAAAAAGDGRRALGAPDRAQSSVELDQVHRRGRSGDRLDRAHATPARWCCACATPASA